MANITVYSFDYYNDNYYKIFAGVYNDFKLNAAKDYKFELEPLDYDNFIKSIKDGLVKCIILLEQDVPTGFLVYTTVISESVELNIIHIVGDENSLQKRTLLLQKFLEDNSSLISQKVVTYALLGKQEEILSQLHKFNFKTINQSVMKFDFSDEKTIKNFREIALPRLNNGYKTVSWNDKYFDDVCSIINNSFKNMSDSKFDPRFLSLKGSQDIVLKIINGIYGTFLHNQTKILLYRNKPVGLCFANLTNNEIANIPLVAVNEKLRGKSYGIYLLKSVVMDIYISVINGNLKLSELNASCDTDNIPAYKMYKKVGFVENYSYKQSYRPYL